jgi:site-specific DNA-methyltransferase (adenine-specific)
MPESVVYNMNCVVGLQGFPDNHFELAVVDPPYGGGQHFNFRFGVDDQVYENRKPDIEYWYELFRVSKNQIVWGGNYFTENLPENRCWISWYKGQPIDSFSDFELAWTSFDETSRAIKLESYGFNHADKKASGNATIHPTQKPISLYRWLYSNYAKPGDKILDTHLGSGSSRIAAYELGFHFTGYEIREDYFNAQELRFKQHISQLTLFSHGTKSNTPAPGEEARKNL